MIPQVNQTFHPQWQGVLNKILDKIIKLQEVISQKLVMNRRKYFFTYLLNETIIIFDQIIITSNS